MSEWITDRLPNEVSDVEYVWITNQHGIVEIASRDLVDKGTPWMELSEPEPYQPPEPDTSLAASIERTQVRGYRKPDHALNCTCNGCDSARILEAARKWDHDERNGSSKANLRDAFEKERAYRKELEKKLAEIDNDPDDIGESEHGKKHEERTKRGK